MHNHTLCTHCYTNCKIVLQELHIPVIFTLGTQVDDILAVNKHLCSSGLNKFLGLRRIDRSGKILFEMGILWTTQEHLIGFVRACDCLDSFKKSLLFANVAANAEMIAENLRVHHIAQAIGLIVCRDIVQEVTIGLTLRPAFNIDFPKTLLQWKNKKELLDIRHNCTIGKDLIEKTHPVVFQHSCELDFKDLSLVPHVRMSSHRTRYNFLFKLERTCISLDNLMNRLRSAHKTFQKRFCCL